MEETSVLQNWATAIEETSLAIYIRESGTVFPWLESVHVMAIALVLGVISIVDLRLMGIAGHGYRTTRLLKTLVPLTWIAFAVAFVTGILMFVTQPGRYIDTFAFQLKMGLLVLAGINMAIFHLWTHRSIQLWDLDGPIPTSAKIAGAFSLCLWLAIVFAGRFIGFTLSFG